MIPAPIINDTDYNKENILALVEEIIVLRDALLEANKFQYAIALSCNIALLKYFADFTN